jgi:hypothetical protein
MTGQTTIDVGYGTTASAPYGSVDQSIALANLHAACVNR